jgi:hypothetical protein
VLADPATRSYGGLHDGALLTELAARRMASLYAAVKVRRVGRSLRSGSGIGFNLAFEDVVNFGFL